ncbi:MAG: O-antigen ligase family protein, partial [Rikenellaceae bacterium]|nr:O-antigen ligase family protein [Rikenellaceae bacterium]
LALLLFDSRAGWMAAAAGMGMVCGKRLLPSVRSYKKITYFLALAVLVIGGALIYHYRPASANARLLIWKVTAAMIGEKPLLGYGVGSFNREYMLRQADYFELHPESQWIPVADNVAYPYNEFLHVAVELGVLGWLLLLGLLFIIFRKKSTEPVQNIYKGGLLASIIFSLFSYPSYVFPLFCLWAVLAGGSISKENNTRISLGRPIIWSVLWVGMMGVALKEWRFYNRVCTDSKHLSAVPADPRARARIDANLGKLIHHPRFNAVYTEYLIRRSQDLTDQTLKQVFPSCETYCDVGLYFFDQGNFPRAETYYRSACRMIPTRLRLGYLLWRLYVATDRPSEAQALAEKLLDQPLKVENTFTIRAKAEIRD